MSSLIVRDVVPLDMVIPPIASASAHIVRRRKVEILPNAQVDYTFAGNNRIEFSIQSPTDFIDTMNSYVRLNLVCTGASAVDTTPTRYLSTGGVHALFKSIELRLPSGVSLELISEYAKYYAANSYATQSKSHVNHVGNTEGDSFSHRAVRWDDDDSAELALLDATGIMAAVSAIAIATGIVTVASMAAGSIKIGDRLQFKNAAGLILYESTVKTVAATGTFTVFTLVDAPVVDPGACYIFKAPQAAREVAANNSVLLTMKPLLQLLSMPELFPLFLLKGGYQLVMELADPAYALQQDTQLIPSTADTLGYTISNARFVAEMVQPSEDIIRQYIALYNDDKIVYPYISSRHYLNTDDGSAGDKSFAHNVNLRSLRYVVGVCESVLSNTKRAGVLNEDSTYANDSVGTFLDGKITSYRWSAGSDSFPQLKVNCSDLMLAEPFAELQKTFGQHGSVLFEPRFTPSQWRKQNRNLAPVATRKSDASIRFMMTTRFDRGGLLTGYDSSVGTMNVDMEVSAANVVGVSASSPRYLHWWYCADTLISVGNSGIVVRK